MTYALINIDMSEFSTSDLLKELAYRNYNAPVAIDKIRAIENLDRIAITLRKIDRISDANSLEELACELKEVLND